jgi:hypothetical protein
MSSTRQRIKCLQEALPEFWKEQKEYMANRRRGVRPRKNKH